MSNRAAFKGSLSAPSPISIALFCLFPLSLPLVRHAVIVLRADANAHSAQAACPSHQEPKSLVSSTTTSLNRFRRAAIKRGRLDVISGKAISCG